MPLDFTSPYDELTELRSLLTTQEIAELTGLRRETISRAHPESHFQRRTEKALRDLYVVVTRMRTVNGGDPAQLGAILRRPQPDLDGNSVADLLRDGKVDLVLQHLDPASAPADDQLKNLHLDPATLSALRASDATVDAPPSGPDDHRLATLLDGDPALAGLLPEIEARISDHFGADARIERAVVADPDDADGRDRLYLRVGTSLSFDEEVERLTALLDREEARLEPFRERLTIGIS